MSRLIAVMLVILTIGAAPGASRMPAWQNKVDSGLLESAVQGETEFLLYLSEQADLSGAAQLKTKAEKGAYVYRQLTEVTQRTQPPVTAALQDLGVEYLSFWVANMIWVRGDVDTLQALAGRTDVQHLYANPDVPLEAPARPLSMDEAETVQENIQQIGADDVWALGYIGQGVVIGGQDTGYDWHHPALVRQYRGWDGASADHNYAWHDAIHSGAVAPCPSNSPEPCDGSGNSHGTHTMGIMVGDDGGANQIGVAPGARWIGCRNMNNAGVGSPATYAECYQWFIAPTDLNGQNPRPDLAPDVISNSWSCPVREGCTDPDVLRAVVESVRAAGILTVHSAGNSGPSCSSISTPAAIYDASFTVGATGGGDEIASFSSRGPVFAGRNQYPKPDVVAPGVSIYSSMRNGGYGWLSGTSMAAPHVAGLAALLISIDPSLRGDVDGLEELIRRTALPRQSEQDCGVILTSGIPNNTYGWGRVDALRAAQQVLPHLLLPLFLR